MHTQRKAGKMLFTLASVMRQSRRFLAAARLRALCTLAQRQMRLPATYESSAHSDIDRECGTSGWVSAQKQPTAHRR